MVNIYDIPITTLIQAVDLVKSPATYLLDTFFSNKLPTANSSNVSIEYRKGKRRLAPYIVEGSRGVNVSREGTFSDFYAPPMLGVCRTITPADIEKRLFGEQPVFSKLTAADRANQIVLQDLNDLKSMITNKQNQMAGELLQTGKIEVEGYADDGRTVKITTIDFQTNNITNATTAWNNANADIYTDIETAVDKIAEDCGELPTIMVVGKNVAKYIMNNAALKEYLLIPNPSYATIGTLAPKYISPQTKYIGTFPSLNVEVYAYFETYYDEKTDAVKPFIDPDIAIVGIPGRGKQVTGAVTVLQNKVWNTYAAEYVPHYTADETSNISSLALYSRFVPVPEVIDSWQVIKTIPAQNLTQVPKIVSKGLPTLAEEKAKK